MALVALAAMGADDERLASFSTSYGMRLVPCRPHLNAARLELLRDLEKDGPTAVLERVLPNLAAGVGGAAFHGLIRLGYGLDHGRASDVAAGLAYLASASQPVEVSASAEATVELGALLDRLHDDPTTARRTFVSRGFGARFAEAAADPVVARLLGGLSPERCRLGEIASTSLGLYRSTGDFFALHTVTATHAARLVVDHLDDEAVAAAIVVGLARAVAVAYVVLATPRWSVRPTVAEIPAWEAIERAAVVSDDPHVLKMVHTCRQEQRVGGTGVSGDRGRGRRAARRLRRVLRAGRPVHLYGPPRRALDLSEPKNPLPSHDERHDDRVEMVVDPDGAARIGNLGMAGQDTVNSAYMPDMKCGGPPGTLTGPPLLCWAAFMYSCGLAPTGMAQMAR
ncbi:MAG: questin oxidase family protein [Microthrixaceae bacterium]